MSMGWFAVGVRNNNNGNNGDRGGDGGHNK